MDIQQEVNRAMRFANQNGYVFSGWTVREVACDLQDYCNSLEGTPVHVLMKCITEWFKDNNVKTERRDGEILITGACEDE